MMWSALLGAALAGGASAAELWSTGEGQSFFSLDEADRSGGLQLEGGRTLQGEWQTPVQEQSAFTFHVSGNKVLPRFSGRLFHEGPLRIAGPASSLNAERFVLVDAFAEGRQEMRLLSEEGAVLFVLADIKFGFLPEANSLQLVADHLSLPAKSAATLGLEHLAGQDLGRMRLDLEVFWVGGELPDSRPVNRPGEGPVLDAGRDPGPDMVFCQLYGLYQASRSGSTVEMSLGTTSWNIGDQDLSWDSGLGNPHPYIIQNLYRENAEGHFEQLSASWIKHGFYALASHQCDLPDLPDCVFEPGHGAGDWLGVGCTDTYSPGLNASGLRPRSEVNPWTGAWSGVNYSGDYALTLEDADIDPAQNPGATYYSEGLYNIGDDINPMNSIAWKPVTFSGSPGGTWSVGMSGSGTLPTTGPALEAWGGTETLVAQEIPVIHNNWGGGNDSPDGRCLLSVKTWDNGDGTWHYEYCLYNVDMHAKVDGFIVPISAGTLISNAEFHAPQQYDAQPYQSAGNTSYTNDPWTINVNANSVAFTSADNPLRWGVMYTFRFDANQPPESVQVQLNQYEPGGPAFLTASTTGPAQGPADCNNNGTPDDEDIDNGTSQDCNGNGVPDECEPDCNNNGAADECDISSGGSLDCNLNGIPDECEADCNNNGVPDECDIAGGMPDCNENGVPDECENFEDCNSNGIPDECELQDNDCNSNGVLDSCDIASGTSQDEDLNGVPDECENICYQSICPDTEPVLGNTSGKEPGENHGSSSCGSSATSPDVFYTYTPAADGSATVETCGYGNYDTVLSIHTACPGTVDNQLFCNDDNCSNYKSSITWDVTANTTYTIRVSGYNNASGDFGLVLSGPPCAVNFPDCNGNFVDDAEDIAGGFSLDCNGNGIPDECDLDEGFSLDCNENGIPDECDISSGLSDDCNTNGFPDDCEFIGGGGGFNDYNRDAIGLQIPDNDPAGVSDELVITDDLPISALEVTLQITHTYNGDLIVSLEHVDTGSSAILIDRPGRVDSGFGSNSNGFDIRLADYFSEDIEDSGNGPNGLVSGDFHPSPDALTLFDGESILGTWRLSVSDNAGSDLGSLEHWGLHLAVSGAPENDCNENGILDECDIASGNSTDGNSNGVPDECEGYDPVNWQSEYFSGANNCRTCHNASPGEGIYVDESNQDISPYPMWEATMMANSARDPYWKAKVGFEVSQMPGMQELIETTCTSCHAPMGHKEAELQGEGPYTLSALEGDFRGNEGVSCTMCHQQTQDDSESTWSGNFSINTQREIYGPYQDPNPTLMLNTTDYTPVHDNNYGGNQTCVSCHTLFTPTFDGSGQQQGEFPEQVPFLEMLNSDFAASTCVSCHMAPNPNEQPVSTLPPGLPDHTGLQRHDVVGGNMMMLELFAANTVALGTLADEAGFLAMADRSREFMATAVDLDALFEEDNGQPLLQVQLDNLSGHKFPTGIPVRRAWLEVIARNAADEIVFHSGAVGTDGVIAGHDAGVEPHYSEIDDPGQVQIYEGRMENTDSQPTWTLLRAAGFAKDNRLLPSGYSAVGPYASVTAPAGAAAMDPAYADGSGSDQLSYRLPLDTRSAEVNLHFQAVNPLSIDPMRTVAGDANIDQFLAMWDALDRSGDVIASTSLGFLPLPEIEIATSDEDVILSWGGGGSWMLERKLDDGSWTSLGLQASPYTDSGVNVDDTLGIYRLVRP